MLSRRGFRTTRWSLVVGAGGAGAAGRAALAEICQAYWPPLYEHVRRRGHTVDDAKELVQEFFTRLIERSDLSRADPARGRFRSFLLASLEHFLANQRRGRRAARRGGGREPISLDVVEGERLVAEPVAPGLSPEEAFDRRFAVLVVGRARARLRAEHEAAGRGERFGVLEVLLAGDGDSSIRDVAARLGISDDAAKAALHRLRRRWRDLVRAEISEIVATPEQVEDELSALLRALSG